VLLGAGQRGRGHPDDDRRGEGLRSSWLRVRGGGCCAAGFGACPCQGGPGGDGAGLGGVGCGSAVRVGVLGSGGCGGWASRHGIVIGGGRRWRF